MEFILFNLIISYLYRKPVEVIENVYTAVGATQPGTYEPNSIKVLAANGERILRPQYTTIGVSLVFA
jgi:hypothetical protein